MSFLGTFVEPSGAASSPALSPGFDGAIGAVRPSAVRGIALKSKSESLVRSFLELDTDPSEIALDPARGSDSDDAVGARTRTAGKVMVVRSGLELGVEFFSELVPPYRPSSPALCSGVVEAGDALAPKAARGIGVMFV